MFLQGGSPREGSSLRGMSPDAPALSWTNAQNRTASAAGADEAGVDMTFTYMSISMTTRLYRFVGHPCLVASPKPLAQQLMWLQAGAERRS